MVRAAYERQSSENPSGRRAPARAVAGHVEALLVGGVLIVLLCGGATAAVTVRTANQIADEVFPKLNQIHTPKGLISSIYTGGPEDLPDPRLRQTLRLQEHRRTRSGAPQRHDPAGALRPRTGTDLGALGPARPARDDQDARRRRSTTRRRSTSPTRSAARCRDTTRAPSSRRRPSSTCCPACELNGHRRRDLRRLHPRRRHAGLRVRQRRPPLLQRKHRHPRNRLHAASTSSPATRSCATKTRSTTCVTATPTRTSCASPASRTSCVTCASRSPPKNARPARKRSPKRWGMRSAPTSRPPRACCSSSPKLIGFSQSKPLRQVKFQTENDDLHAGRGILRHLHSRPGARDARGIPARPPHLRLLSAHSAGRSPVAASPRPPFRCAPRPRRARTSTRRPRPTSSRR